MKQNATFNGAAACNASPGRATSGDIVPISILRVADNATPSGFLLYSGLTHNTMMAPARPLGQCGVGDAVSCQERSTQTDDPNTITTTSNNGTIRNNSNNSAPVSKCGGDSRYKSKIAETLCSTSRKDRGCKEEHAKISKGNSSSPMSGCVSDQANFASQRLENKPERFSRSCVTSHSCVGNKIDAPETKLCKSLYLKGTPPLETSARTHQSQRQNRENKSYQCVDSSLQILDAKSFIKEIYSHDDYNKYARQKKCLKSANVMKADERKAENVSSLHNNMTTLYRDSQDSTKKSIKSKQVQGCPSRDDSPTGDESALTGDKSVGQKTAEGQSKEITDAEDNREVLLSVPADTKEMKNTPTKASIPVISWQESAPEEDLLLPRRNSVQLSTYSMFEPFCKSFPPAPSHTPRILVPPKHTSPEGLTADDIVTGKCLNPEGTFRHSSSDSFTQNEETRGKSHEDLTSNKQADLGSGSMVRRVKSAAEPMNYHITDGSPHHNVKCTKVHNGMLIRPKTSSSIPSERVVSLELSITSLCTDRQQSNHLGPHAPTGHPDTKNSSSSAGLDTVEAIRRSFRRAQSAPPLAPASRCDSHKFSSPDQALSTTTPTNVPISEDGRKFSYLYWRARSAYHRRNIDAKELVAKECDAIDLSTQADLAAETHQIKGTLLRPLMFTSENGMMKHGAGCPYKCKNCFRACLVSEDFAHRSRMKREELLSELRGGGRYLKSYSGSRTNGNSRPSTNVNYLTKDRQFSRRRMDASTILKRALARGQPLFQRVYGSTGHPQNILPWPTHAWVDIKHGKTDQAQLTADESSERGDGNN